MPNTRTLVVVTARREAQPLTFHLPEFCDRILLLFLVRLDLTFMLEIFFSVVMHWGRRSYRRGRGVRGSWVWICHVGESVEKGYASTCCTQYPRKSDLWAGMGRLVQAPQIER